MPLQYHSLDKALQEQIKADSLLHVEAFDEKSKKSTRLSVSTKIFEYLYAGKIILGYGPSDVASMEYLRDIGCSVLCADDLSSPVNCFPKQAVSL